MVGTHEDTLIAFFHQNDAFGRQGGIERYVATLIKDQSRAVVVSPPLSVDAPNHFTIAASGWAKLPAWLRFVMGIFRQRHAVRAFLRENAAKVLEFSRPEYVLIAWLFAGKRVFTIHGTGPQRQDRLHYVVHHTCCCLLPLVATRVQVVGRDRSGLPRLAQFFLRSRLAHIDAWYDDRFRPLPLPPLTQSLRVFYAGRLASQKNPELLFGILRLAQTYGLGFEFHYFGSDYSKFEDAGLGGVIRNHGLLSPAELACAIGDCHVGLLCSGFGEGSPFVVVETLACGRTFVLPPLPTLVQTYANVPGIRFVDRYDPQAFIDALIAVREELCAGHADPAMIAAGVAPRSQTKSTRALLDGLLELAA